MEMAKTSPQGLDIVAQETVSLMVELQRLGQRQLVEIIKLVVAGEYVLASCLLRVAQRQLNGCSESLALLDRVWHLIRATKCPHAAQELLERA